MKRCICMLLCACLLLSTGCARQTTEYTGTCTVRISCAQILQHREDLNEAKTEFVPSDGSILRKTSVPFSDGETVYDVLRRACATHLCDAGCTWCRKDGSIQMESTGTGSYGMYVEGIHNLYEKDCGSLSGWTFTVNGDFASEGCDRTVVHDGDAIECVFSCTYEDFFDD